MAKYKLTESGVCDIETGLIIPNTRDNRHWMKYQEWLAAGNTSDTADPSPELISTRIIDGEKISTDTRLALAAAQTVDELRAVVTKILIGPHE